MPFKSDEQRKHVMAVLKGQRHTLVGYHASLLPLKKLSDEKTFHIGTKQAAIRRGHDVARSDKQRFFHLYRVSVPVRKDRVLLTSTTPRTHAPGMVNYPDDRDGMPGKTSRITLTKRVFDEGRGIDFARLDPYLNLDGVDGYSPLMVGSRKARLMHRLRKRYDIIPYINRIESGGEGSMSVAILNPRKAHFKLVRRVPYKASTHRIP